MDKPGIGVGVKELVHPPRTDRHINVFRMDCDLEQPDGIDRLPKRPLA